jgi:hypothetical protein
MAIRHHVRIEGARDDFIECPSKNQLHLPARALKTPNNGGRGVMEHARTLLVLAGQYESVH